MAAAKQDTTQDADSRFLSSWLANLPLQWKIGSIILILLTLFLVLLATSAITLRRGNILQEQTNAMMRNVELANTVGQALAERRSSLAQGVLVKAANLRQRLEVGEDSVGTALASMREATTNVPALKTIVDRAEQLNSTWAQAVAEPLISAAERAARQEISQDELNEAVRNYIATEVGENGSRAILGLMTQLVSRAQAELQVSRAELKDTEETLRMVDLGALAATLIAGIMAMFLTARLITRPLRDLAGRMEQLAAHNHDIDVPYAHRRDEVGTIARALDVFKAMAIETYDRDWVKSGTVAVSRKLQQADDIASFAESLLTELAPRVNAGVGVFYAFEQDTSELVLAGSYAFTERRHVSTHYKIGEGLVGQAARERKAITLAPVPDDYIRIHSGVGEATPRAIVALPILRGEALLGVIELASFEPFSGPRAQLLSEVVPVVALSLENLNRAVRALQLLEQTQRQATELRVSEEELRTQQEELRTTNDQLQEKSQRLAASEEELRVQADELQRSNAVLRHNSEELVAQKAQLEVISQEAEARADELGRANQYKSQFLANMSHELRTPLNSLLILAHDLSENHTGHLDADEVEAASIIHSSGSNLLRLINDILDLSKVEAGKMDVVHEPISIPAVATRMERNFRHVADEKGISFKVTITPDAPTRIVSDDGKLEQITNNLLGNAFKFTGEGGVSVTFARGAGDTLTVSVTDTGIGIPDDKKDTIFQAFEQVDSSTRRQFGGTGLGLAITQRLAHLLGGDVSVESRLGEGSTFRVVLPIGNPDEIEPEPAAISRPAAPMAPAAPAPRPAPSVDDDRGTLQEGQTTILVVEDDVAFARTLVGLVRRKGYQVLAATDGESALDLARRFKPTGILLDVMLPGMDGWTVIERLKGDAATRHIPVHFVSALDEAKRGRDLGAVGFLTKPVSAEDLNGALTTLAHFSVGQPRRVLVVDDDAGARLAVRKLIGTQQVEVLEAASGEEALELISANTVDCVVLDLGLPGMSGFEMLERVAAGPHPIPVVVYSGRDLTPEESLKLRAFTDSIVIKGARSPERLMDEVSLFLHSVRHEAKALAGDPDADLKGRRLLLVDDDMRNIFALAKVLRGKGIDVQLAQDGAKALAQLDAHPDLEIVLMDIMMPVMDGYEAMTEIRKRPQFAKLPIIALTAKAMKDDREKCLAAGASDYLAKPIDVPKLLSMLRAWLPQR